MTVTPVDIGSIVVALIAAGGAWASKRSADKAATVSSRMDAEKEAYERARAFDMQTIAQQKEDIKDLREQLSAARERIAVLESSHPTNLERLLRERLKEPDSPGD